MNNTRTTVAVPPGKLSPPVIYYHSVAPSPFTNWVQHFLTLPLSDFEEQLIFLCERGYSFVFLDEWMEYRTGRKQLREKEICLAFDDGLLDNWVYVWPLVQKYNVKFTLFVSPECVSAGDSPRPTLIDVWEGRCTEHDLIGLGYLNWPELIAMQESGFVDIQSHTMTHAKYPVSGSITGFYNGGFPGLHPILNASPEIRPYYMNLPDFESRMPKGTPLFEEKSAVIAHRVTINPEFFHDASVLAKQLADYNTTIPPQYEKDVIRLKDRYEKQDRLIIHRESENEYEERLRYEILQSKIILESRLAKPVDFLCWPHGDNTQKAHDMAIDAGYRATTAGKMVKTASLMDRIPRFGTTWNHELWLNKLKLHYKISSHYKKQPFYTIWLMNDYKNQLLGRN